MRRFLVLLAALAFPVAASADVGPRHLKVPSVNDSGTGYITLLDNIALNGSSTVRTFTLTGKQIDGMAKAVLTVKRTRVAGTDLTMSCTQSPDGGTTLGQLTVCYFDSSGTCTSSTATWKSSTSSTETLTWEVGVLGYGQLACTFASTSAGATDKLTVLGTMVTQ